MSANTDDDPPVPPAPTPEDVSDRARFDKLVDDALANVRSSAEKWRTGLAALVTLATTALLISGPASAADLPAANRYLIVALLLIGLLVAVTGLWLALSAASGVPENVTYPGIRKEHPSVRAFQVHLAGKAAKLLKAARWLVALSLAAFIAGMAVWWLTPPNTPKIAVVAADGTTCGTLKSADNRVYRVQVAGEAAPRSLPFADVLNVAVVGECG